VGLRRIRIWKRTRDDGVGAHPCHRRRSHDSGTIAEYLGKHDFRSRPSPTAAQCGKCSTGEVVDLVCWTSAAGRGRMALARQLRDGVAIPIIMLTGRSEEADRVMGLELGADDYLTSRSARGSCSRAFPAPCCAAAA